MITDLINKKFVSCRYYNPLPGSIWTAPNAIQHKCGPNATFRTPIMRLSGLDQPRK